MCWPSNPIGVLKLVLTSIVNASYIGATIVGAAADVDAKITRGPYLQLGTPHSITIVWRTLESMQPVVLFGLESSKLDRAVPISSIVVRNATTIGEPADPLSLHSAPEGTIQYEAIIEGLEPDTKYYYSIANRTNRLAGGDTDHYFRTHPTPGAARPTRVWVVGDSGTGDARQAAVHNAMRKYVEHQNKPLDLYLHVGDMAYSKGTDAEFQTNFFDVYQPTIRNTVCWASMGNHEGQTSKGLLGIGPYYDAYVCPKRAEAGGLPSTTEAFYSFDYANIHFVCLDSHDLDRKPAGIMAQWLRADLEKANTDWIVAYWHHPPYTKGSHDSDKEEALIEMRELIMPIIEAGGVDLVLTGHSHIYERSMLIDGAYQTPTTAEGVVLDDGDGDPNGDGPYRKSKGLHAHQGTVQVVTGNGGAKVTRLGTSPVMKRVIVEYGSVLLDIDGDTLIGSMINRAGDRSDLFSIVKQGTVIPKVMASPRTLPPYTVAANRPKILPSEMTPFPKNAVTLVKPNAEWDYLANATPPAKWTSDSFIPDDVSGWKSGVSGIGYGDSDDVTELKDMKGAYASVYARTDFELPPGMKEKFLEVGLAIAYDDGFVAYLNGHEVLRVGVKAGPEGKVKDVKSHEADGYEYFPLIGAIKYLNNDENILSVECHNDSIDSSDFTLDPYLLAVPK